MHRDPSLDTLLDLDGVIIGGLAGGHWVKFDVCRVPATAGRPYGIRYSMTLHDASGSRVFGMDNAHAIAIRRGVQTARSRTFDHVHRAKGDKGIDYPYQDAASLIRDFWLAVDRILEERK
ncbi:MAG: DUF6516 family protein [Lysobacter sp.]|nr:DUF6516 family protein [Lysobacter sp.]